MPHEDSGVLVEARGASFGWASRPVVGPLDLVVRRGDFLAIVGPNGSGKSTLARGLVGLLAPLAGSCVRSTRRVGFVPQREALDPVWPITVEEVVRTGAAGALSGWRGYSKEQRDAVRARMVEVGVDELRAKPFRSLSGGQRQRVLVARALVARPELLVMDEPTSGVDRDAALVLRELLAALVRETGLTLVVVTHQLELVRGAATRVLRVEGGRAREVAPGELERAGGAPVGGS
ncbi:MAG: metal ABC transporter ATP-binding protein [Planctomycetia bacterium]